MTGKPAPRAAPRQAFASCGFAHLRVSATEVRILRVCHIVPSWAGLRLAVMSKRSRRGHRRQGHPANVARDRDRAGSRRGAGAVDAGGVVRRIMREARELTDPLDAELWGSAMLGLFWNARYELPLEEVGSDPAARLGGPLIEAMTRIGGVGAGVALAVVEAMDDGELGWRAGEMQNALSEDVREGLPAWVAELGEVVVTGAAVIREDVFDDACTMFLEARLSNGDIHAVGVLIDNNLGEMATDILLADSIDLVREVVRQHPRPDGDVKLERIAPGIAARRIHDAIELTDMTWQPPVSEDYADLRALALRRAHAVPGLAASEERPELSSAERDRLMEEFLTSPEGDQFAPDSDDAYAVSLAIGFCADYVDGRPLRWSPTVVELFMADWIPRKVIADADLFERLPAALDAWVRFAGRKSDLPEWAIASTREAIPRWHETMVQQSDDPAAAGVAKQFMLAAKTAGIDTEDEDALKTFVAGWNARSEVG
jgi:hypothetical protein